MVERFGGMRQKMIHLRDVMGQINLLSDSGIRLGFKRTEDGRQSDYQELVRTFNDC